MCILMMMRLISILRVCKIAVITHTEPLAKIRIAKAPATFELYIYTYFFPNVESLNFKQLKRITHK